MAFSFLRFLYFAVVVDVVSFLIPLVVVYFCVDHCKYCRSAQLFIAAKRKKKIVQNDDKQLCRRFEMTDRKRKRRFLLCVSGVGNINLLKYILFLRFRRFFSLLFFFSFYSNDCFNVFISGVEYAHTKCVYGVSKSFSFSVSLSHIKKKVYFFFFYSLLSVSLVHSRSVSLLRILSK